MRMHIISGGMLTVVVLINELLLVDGLAADLALLENADALLGELPLYLLNHKVLVRMRLDEDEGRLKAHGCYELPARERRR